MKILVASNSEIKLSAVREGLPPVFSIDVHGHNSKSLVNEQPVEAEETLHGAINRLDRIVHVEGYDYYVAIENGIEQFGGLWSDFAIVVMQDRNGNRKIAKSAGVIFPEEYVIEARKRGFETTTVGSVIAEKLGGSNTDPHKTLTGWVSRKEILTQAVRICYGRLTLASLYKKPA